MRALLDNPAVVDDDDFVGAGDGGQAVVGVIEKLAGVELDLERWRWFDGRQPLVPQRSLGIPVVSPCILHRDMLNLLYPFSHLDEERS